MQQQPMHTFSTNTGPTSSYKYDSNGRTSQQSRRESLHDIHRRLSQQSLGPLPIENSINGFIGSNSGDKYVQDSFETEKLKSNQTSPNTDDNKSQLTDIRRKGSIRFYDEAQPFAGNTGIENISSVKENEYEYGKSIHEQEQVYKNPTSYDHSESVFKAGQYNTSQNYDASQYIEQKNYNGNQYGEENLHPANEYEYQQFAPNFEQSGYESNQQPTEFLYQPEQYFGFEKNEIAQQNFAQSTSNSLEIGQIIKGNENSAIANTMSKQSSKKKFT